MEVTQFETEGIQEKQKETLRQVKRYTRVKAEYVLEYI